MMMRRQPKRTRILDWLICGVIALVAIAILALGVFGKLYGTTPKDKLTTASGIAHDAKVSTVRGRYGATTDFLWFSVDQFRVSYASDKEGYERVLEAVRSGQPMEIKVSTIRETLLPRKGWVPLYELSISDEPILTYEETVSAGDQGSNAVFILGGVLLVAASLGLYRCVQNRNIPPA